MHGLTFSLIHRISQYHTEIELIPFDELNSNIYIQVPVSLETYFVQGSYQKILTEQRNVPCKEYNFFIEKLVNAIRYEIARSAEVSYQSISMADMQKMFMIDTMQEMTAFIKVQQQECQGTNIDWVLNGNRVVFTRSAKEVAEIPSEKMINYSLDYATELNRII